MRRYRTPLRYPGGKQRLTPFVAELLAANGLVGGHYVEPYAGGAGVAMELLLSGLVSHVHLNDSSPPIHAFWLSVRDDAEAMCRRIKDVQLSVEEWRKQREILRHPAEHSQLDLGFSTLYLNRCNRSGALNGGVIGGLEQTGEWTMDVRFPRNELIHRVEAIAGVRTSISIRGMDAEQYITEYVPDVPENTLVYCDPPYFAKSARLYLDHYRTEDHSRVAAVIQEQLQRKWLVSYDSAPEVIGYYRERRCFVYPLQYNARRVYKGEEVFVFSDDVELPAASALKNVDAAIRAYRAAASFA